jgi:hypothetical protein
MLGSPLHRVPFSSQQANFEIWCLCGRMWILVFLVVTLPALVGRYQSLGSILSPTCWPANFYNKQVECGLIAQCRTPTTLELIAWVLGQTSVGLCQWIAGLSCVLSALRFHSAETFEASRVFLHVWGANPSLRFAYKYFCTFVIER